MAPTTAHPGQAPDRNAGRPKAERSPALLDLECIQCGARHPVADLPRGCPVCDAAGRNSNMFCRYADEAPLAERVPYPGIPDPDQGPTPLLPWEPNVYVKNEAVLRTGSHKDRFAAVVAAHAQAAGYRAVALGSSGNAGLAMAAYAAEAGLRCTVAAFEWLPETTRRFFTDLGADLRTFDDDRARLRCIRDLADDPETLTVSNITDPVVGSHPLGIEGYKHIAWEIADQVPEDVDHVVVPSSRGDLAWGICLGFWDLHQVTGRPVPKLHLVEPFPRLSAVLDGAAVTDRFPGDHGRLSSIAGSSTTVQAHRAVTLTGGTATVVPDDTADTYYRLLCRRGHVWERSSVTVFAALASLREKGVVRDDSVTVLVATSHFFKGL
ncbi:PLP-dependent lyase/thiolase [Streptomyces sp. LPB2020-019-1HS]|uniref:PLP-dependent lyase/thiolase n=1 Tax=Streptomyces sp. LPB2020-019-1HS TaxID=3409689 RepID=UPI003B676A2D